MAERRLREKKVTSRSVFKGKLLDVYSDEVQLSDGSQTIREYIRHPGAAVIVPLLDDNRIIMVRQFRYPIGAVMVELPAGKLDPGESSEETARRELLEEVGCTADEYLRLGRMHPCIGYSTEQIDVFLARSLRHQKNNLDEDEQLEPFELPLAEAVEWIRQGRITDAKTIIALYWAERYLKGEWGN